MANKFLGLDNVNVLIDYIDKKIKYVNENTRVLTIQAYKYVVNTEDAPVRPQGGGFDINAGISYPEGWNSLHKTTIDLVKDYDNAKDAFEALKEILASTEGSIWMSAGVVHGNNPIEWSVPAKVNGINGLDGKDGKDAIDFRYSYKEVCAQENREVIPPVAVDEDGKRVVYYWVKPVDGEWPADDETGMVWNKFTTDGISANQVIYRYRLTSYEDVTTDENGIDTPIAPAGPTGSNDSKWVKSILNVSMDKENPYLWMSTANIVAGTDGKDAAWSEPILFSSLGKDGNVPDYTITLYCKGAEEDGLIKPDAPVFVEDTNISEYKTEPWVEVPTEEGGYWWQCTFKVKGLNNTVLEIGDVKRYNGVNGEAQPGEWTEMCFCWSETQDQPALEVIEGAIYPAGWSTIYPNIAPNTLEPTLWITLGKFKGMNEDGTPKLISEWSEPVRITGPAGPLSNDCRLEMRYAEGTATAPNANAIWEDDPGKAKLNNTYMYLWAKPYLVYYKMKYADTPNEDGTFDIIQVSSVPDGVIKEFTPYRASGLNGDNGNIKNKVAYNVSDSTIDITSFVNDNMYIYNGSSEINYVINYNLIDFETGYTGKFSNVGTGTVKISCVDPYEFIGSGKLGNDKENIIREITLSPQETVELVCYKSGELKQFIVIGKTI